MVFAIQKINGTNITNEVCSEIIEYHKKVFENLERLSLYNMTPNPLLMKTVGHTAELRSAEDVVNYLVNTRMERSTTTVFGNTTKNIAMLFGQTSLLTGVDMEIDRIDPNDGIEKRYYIRLKSGPMTVNKDICLQIKRGLELATKDKENVKGLLGVIYGKRSMINNVVRNYLSFDFEIGREFWEFISGDPHCYKKIWALISIVAEEYEYKKNMNLKSLIASKKKELTEEFKEIYSDEGKEIWEKLLEFNM